MAYWDAFEQRENLRYPFCASLAFHVATTALILGFAWWKGHHELIGSPTSGPGVASVSTVDSIPVPRRSALRNPLANDTESQAPNRAKPEVKPVEKEDPEAVAIGPKKKKKEPKKKLVAQLPRRYTPEPEYKPNQVFSTSGARISTPMYTPSAGGGGVGVGTSPFGSRLGWYADQIQQRIAAKWRSQDLDARMNNLEVVVTFDIQRSGSVTGIRVIKSASYAMDNSATRAVQEASPLPPLPPEFERRIANVEFHFKLQR